MKYDINDLGTMEKRLLLTNLKSKIWIIISLPIVAGVIAWFLVGSLQKKYRSVAQLAVEFPSHRDNVTPEEAEIEILNHVEAMKTEFMGLMVSYNLLIHDLAGVPFRKNNFTILPQERRNATIRLKNKLDSFDILSPYNNFEYLLMDAIDRKGYHVVTDEALKIGRVGNTNFIFVEFKSENPALSAFVTNKLCTEYMRYSSYITRNPIDSLNFLAKVVEKRKDEWKTSADLLNKCRSEKASNVERGGLREKDLNQLTEEEEKMAVSTSALRDINDKIASIRSNANETQQGSIRNNQKIVQLQSKIDELSKLYSKQGSIDKELANSIHTLRKQLQNELARLEQSGKSGKQSQLDQYLKEKNRIESNHAIISQNISLIRERLERVKHVSTDGPSESLESLELQYDKSMREYIRVRDAYERARTRIQSVVPGTTLKIASVGRPNFTPESVDKPLVVFLVMIGCAIITVLAILALAYFHRPRPPVDPYFVVLR